MRPELERFRSRYSPVSPNPNATVDHEGKLPNRRSPNTSADRATVSRSWAVSPRRSPRHRRLVGHPLTSDGSVTRLDRPNVYRDARAGLGRRGTLRRASRPENVQADTLVVGSATNSRRCGTDRNVEQGGRFGATMTALSGARDLRFTHGFDAGLSRTGSPGSFAYIGPDGSVIDDPATLERIRALAIPPAWASVWIAPEADAHLQATGIDRRGRKQYRYHASWRHERDELEVPGHGELRTHPAGAPQSHQQRPEGRHGAFASAGPRSRPATA